MFNQSVLCVLFPSPDSDRSMVMDTSIQLAGLSTHETSNFQIWYTWNQRRRNQAVKPSSQDFLQAAMRARRRTFFFCAFCDLYLWSSLTCRSTKSYWHSYTKRWCWETTWKNQTLPYAVLGAVFIVEPQVDATRSDALEKSDYVA